MKKTSRIRQIIIFISSGILLLILVWLLNYIIIPPSVNTPTLNLLNRLTLQDEQLFAPLLTTLGIVGNPTILKAACSPDDIGTSFLETVDDCSSSISYPNNFTQVLTPEQLASFSAHAATLDTLFQKLGWADPAAKTVPPARTFSALNPNQPFSAFDDGIKNVLYVKQFGTYEYYGSIECDFTGSLDGPPFTSSGEVLAVDDFQCYTQLDYPHLNFTLPTHYGA